MHGLAKWYVYAESNFHQSMKTLLLPILVGILLFSSCKKDHQLWLKINHVGGEKSTIYVYYNREFSLDNPNFFLEEFDSVLIYESTSLNQTPPDILQSHFDSIVIETATGKKAIFRPDTALGYSQNPFLEAEVWKFSQFETDFPTNFRRNETDIDQYTFLFDSGLVDEL